MKTNKYAVIRAKYRSPLIGGGYCKVGEPIVMFPRNIFIGRDENDKKMFMNSYVRLNDLHKFPEFKTVRDEIATRFGINPDTFSLTKITWRH